MTSSFPLRFATTSALGLVLAGSALAQDDVEGPGPEALEEFRSGRSEPNAIENRFFLKEKRFEIALRGGYVPNNSLAQRYVGALTLNYHLNETVAIGADISFSPDLGKGDLRSLAGVLLQKAAERGDRENEFQQPLDKVTLSAAFGVTWAPVYGKINLIGESVLNFDLYGFLGVGMVSIVNYTGTYNDCEGACAPNDFVTLTQGINEVRVAPAIGIGQNYFLTQSIALKIDAKASFYIDDTPLYDPMAQPDGQKLYNNFIASVGIAGFFPKMKPRLYDF